MNMEGKAAKSASGAAMSKYDVEVEARLQALEKAVAECQECCKGRGSSSDGDANARIDDLLERLGRKMKF